MGKYEVSTVQSGERVSISVSGDLSISSISDIRSDIIRELMKKEIAHIEVLDPENIDLTFLQLLISLLKSESYNGRVSLELKLSKEIEDLMITTGMLDVLSKAMKKI